MNYLPLVILSVVVLASIANTARIVRRMYVTRHGTRNERDV